MQLLQMATQQDLGVVGPGRPAAWAATSRVASRAERRPSSLTQPSTST